MHAAKANQSWKCVRWFIVSINSCMTLVLITLLFGNSRVLVKFTFLAEFILLQGWWRGVINILDGSLRALQFCFLQVFLLRLIFLGMVMRYKDYRSFRLFLYSLRPTFCCGFCIKYIALDSSLWTRLQKKQGSILWVYVCIYVYFFGTP